MLARAEHEPAPRPSPPAALPSALLAVELGPAVMADDPCQAAVSAADPPGPSKYYRARYYDPKLGRFLSEDPIGFEGGDNFYAYVGNNPATFADPLGLCPQSFVVGTETRNTQGWPGSPTTTTRRQVAYLVSRSGSCCEGGPDTITCTYVVLEGTRIETRPGSATMRRPRNLPYGAYTRCTITYNCKTGTLNTPLNCTLNVFQ